MKSTFNFNNQKPDPRETAGAWDMGISSASKRENFGTDVLSVDAGYLEQGGGGRNGRHDDGWRARGMLSPPEMIELIFQRERTREALGGDLDGGS